ncbi:ABC transporter permease [Candidatus Saccharibacteria bacterium]|nr:ABC transporter permease [Candidatus Saccharibacteria bacterium]
MKRKFITLLRIIRAGFQNFARNLTLGIAAMAVMVITLTILLFSVIANATFIHTIEQITDKIDISVYLKDSVSEQRRDELITDLKRNENVKSVNYVSKEQALEIYKEQNADNVDLLVAISQTDNPLPASLQVKPHNPNEIDAIKQYLEQPDIKELQSDETSYSGDRKEAIDKISQATTFFREAGLVGVVVFMIVSMLIIFNTIRMAIFNRRDELTIMRLLGASTIYIRGPFIVETVVYGVFAGVISISLVGAMFAVSASAFGASSLGLLDISYANNFYSSYFWLIVGAQIFIGVAIGATSSFVATRKYLKFKTSK